MTSQPTDRRESESPPVEKKNKDIWFPAKEYGWGWGAPVTWQGWAVMIGWVAVLMIGSVVIMWFSGIFSDSPSVTTFYSCFLPFLFLTSALLFAICLLKGERPRWRWGRKKGECHQCGYDLTGNTSGICPECGEPIPGSRNA